MEGPPHAGGGDQPPRCGGGGVVGVGALHHRPPPAGEVPGERHPQALGNRERSALDSGRDVRRGHSPPTRPQRCRQPGRRPPPGRQPSAAREDEQTRREEQTAPMRPRTCLPAESPGHGQVLMRRPWVAKAVPESPFGK